jgi:hypothetical protein
MKIKYVAHLHGYRLGPQEWAFMLSYNVTNVDLLHMWLPAEILLRAGKYQPYYVPTLKTKCGCKNVKTDLGDVNWTELAQNKFQW